MKMIAKKAGQAMHILNRFHIMAHLSKAIDEVRAQEVKLSEVVQYNLKSIRSYLLKEEFQLLWSYQSPYWAGKFLDKWCTKTMRSKIEPMKKVARMLRRHRPLLLNWFRAKGQLYSAVVEGVNNKAKLPTRKAFGFRTCHAMEIALHHALGDLPEPEFTHGFC